MATVAFVSNILQAQLSTGRAEGLLRDAEGHSLGGARILISGSPGFRTVVTTQPDGGFAVVLPYGWYQFSAETKQDVCSSSVSAFLAPLQTARLDLMIDASGVLHRAEPALDPSPGLFSDATRARTYPEAISLHGLLLGREPASVTEPLDFTGLSDIHLAVASQRGYTWTGAQYRFLGFDATDSYQPGRPLILPDVQALDAVVVRSAYAQTASRGYGTEIGLFPAQPGASWHGTLSTADTGSFLASSNLPPPPDRGIVQQAQKFRWFTRDSGQAGGPVAKWADIFVAGTAQWSLQTVPLASPGNDQRARLLFGTVRGRFRAGPGDQFDSLFSGSRINLSNWGVPNGLEALAGRRMSPSFALPGGFAGLSEIDHSDFLQAGWVHSWSPASLVGILQVRYGYSVTHMSTATPPQLIGVQQTKIELQGGTITGAPPIADLAVRTRQGVEVAWQPSILRAGVSRHQISAGAGGQTSAPLDRIAIPFDVTLITANGMPAFVAEFDSPFAARSIVRSFTGNVADHVTLPGRLSLELGALIDLSRGSLPAQSKGEGQSLPLRTFPPQPDLIVWNSVSPRIGFAWQVPHLPRLVLRGAYFRLYSPLAGRYLDFGNPNSLGGNVYQWIDRNSDGRFQPGEEGTLLMRFGGPYSSISPSLHRPYADEIDAGAGFALARRSFVSVHLFRRDDKQRLAAVNVGVPPSAFTPVTILDPGPDGIPGTADDQRLVVYEQNPATFGKDQYLLTNPAGLRMLNEGLLAELRGEWRALMLHASFLAEKSYGPTNPGDAFFENDPGVIGALYSDPNTGINAANRSFMDRAYVGKMQAAYRLPSAWGGIEVASIANYLDGLVFARQLLVTGLAQGPFLVPATVRGSPEGGNRAEYVLNWNLRILREFRLPVGRLAAAADILNVLNAGHKIQENDFSGPSFNLRLPVAIQEPRSTRFQLRYEF